MGSNNNHFTTIAKFSPGTPFVEAFGLLAANLVLADGKNGGTGIHSVAVVGAEEGHGVSTTALNLALMAAATGRRTLLVDANLRSPSLHLPFGLPVGPGLAEMLQKKTVLKDAVKAAKTSNLYVLTGGTLTGSPHALFQSEMLGPIFEQIKATYDFAVLDTPPALRYPDALHLARQADGAIVVLPAEGAGRRAEQEVRRRMERVDVNILGIVLNRMDPREVVAP
ncbi:MAG TPA: CpsD/CapB family tyrosine-protein kinase [bacterium]|jgi:capsular exopolysaccharide synthesis family protein|nr:CpsD/CapB family tyrosine-protein kinase [bacterium]